MVHVRRHVADRPQGKATTSFALDLILDGLERMAFR
jgi:hypothetical protein